jgi:tetratricopeptide (TPR) repeat protein
MSLKTERDLTPTSRSQYTRAKTAAQSKNFDYTIALMQAVLKEEPLFLEGRQFLRAVEIQKYRGTGAFARQMMNVKLTGAVMKLSTKHPPEEQLVQSEEVLADDPFQHKANVMIGDAGTALGYPEFKCFAYETLADGKPADKGILMLLAQSYMEAKDPVKAENAYGQILKLDPNDGDALSGLKASLAAKSHKSWTGAEKEGDFRKALKDEGEAGKLEQEAKVVKSADAIQAQIERNFEKFQAEPTNPAYPKAIAQLCLQRNDYENAITYYQYAFDAGGKIDSSLEKTIGDLKLKKADIELTALRNELAAQTDPELQAQAQAAVEAKEKDLNEARLFLAEARVRAQPNEGEFRYDLGEALYKVGQYKRAAEELQQSLKQPSVRYQALNMMGLAFMKRGMLDFAVNRLSLAKSELLAMDETKKEITYNLGLVYELAKQPDKALEQWKEIYEIDMGYRDVAARVEASYGDSSEAA